MVNKQESLAKILVQTSDIKNYVILVDDDGGRYIRYAFMKGCPENKYNLPKWSAEMQSGNIYELSGYTGDHWAFKDTKPIDVNMLVNKKFKLSVNEIEKLLS